VRFEDLIRKKPLREHPDAQAPDGERLLQRRGAAGAPGVERRAKRKFQSLYQRGGGEDSRDLATPSGAGGGARPRPAIPVDEFQADFRRFRREREDFEKQAKRRGVRPRDVRRLKEAIHRILSRVEPSAARNSTGRAIPRWRESVRPSRAPRSGAGPGEPTPSPAAAVPAVDASWRAEEDPADALGGDPDPPLRRPGGGGAVPGRPVSGETVQRSGSSRGSSRPPSAGPAGRNAVPGAGPRRRLFFNARRSGSG